MSETRNAGRGPGSQPTAHRCPVGGCRAKVRADRLMCAPHWRMTPDRRRALVWPTGRPGAGAHTPAHWGAGAAAVAAVDEALEVLR
jgi:hypothetical protein